jgi:hypothetical protein
MTAQACQACGETPRDGAVQCAYCRNDLAWEGAEPPLPKRTVQQAVDAWGRSVFGGPRHLGRLVKSVAVRDEVIERLHTTIVRREVQEVRGRGPSGRRGSPRVDSRSVDPFATTLEELRQASHYLTSCAVCGGSGTCVCRSCGGGGRQRCGNCSGSGQEVRHYKKSSRMVKCTVCRGSGTLACGGCGARGSVGCDGCGATGNQVAWLSYSQTERSLLYATDSPVIAGHPQLSEARHVARADLSAFTLAYRAQAASTLPEGTDMPPALLRTHLDRIDPRLERVTGQQYVRLAVVRRDATFEMCAMSGKLVLSGDELVASTTDHALWPIKFRRLVWTLLFIAVFALGVFFLAGRSALPYFESANTWIRWLTLAGLALTIPCLGILLRQLSKTGRVRRLVAHELAIVAGCLMCFGVAGAVAAASRPRLAEVDEALASKDTAGARTVLNALLDTQGNVPAFLDAQDRVDLTEAAGKGLDSKLGLLDGVAARKGTNAPTAAKLGREARLAAITEYVKAGSAAAAVRAITKWFGPDSRDAAVGELYAQAEEQLLHECKDIVCRFDAAKNANKAAPNATRAAAYATRKAELLKSLTFEPVVPEALAARLQRLRELGDRAAAARDVVTGDAELDVRVGEATAFAASERAKVAVFGAQEPVVEELLGPLTRKTATISLRSSGTAETFVVFDQQRRCRGVYLIGNQPKARALAGAAAEAVLSQAVGHAASLKKAPSNGAATLRWVEGGVPVVARWMYTTLVELRIGDAAP